MPHRRERRIPRRVWRGGAWLCALAVLLDLRSGEAWAGREHEATSASSDHATSAAGAPVINEARKEAAARARATPRGTRARPRRAPASHDALPVPSGAEPSVHVAPRRAPTATVGWAGSLDRPTIPDRRRRGPAPLPIEPWAELLGPGLNFRYELYFGGNPTGTVEAGVVARRPGSEGAGVPGRGDVFELRALAVTSGVLGMFAKVEDEMTSIVDARTGASVENRNIVRRSGMMTPYRLRTTDTTYEGRGFVRIHDRKDERVRRVASRVPSRTLDPLSLIAWIRSLELEPGQQAVAHTLDVSALLRVDVVSRGTQAPSVMPSLASALGLSRDGLQLLEGTMTRVDRYGMPIPGKKSFTFRAWVSTDERRIPVLMETNIWVGTLRLILAGYDPPVRG